MFCFFFKGWELENFGSNLEFLKSEHCVVPFFFFFFFSWKDVTVEFKLYIWLMSDGNQHILFDGYFIFSPFGTNWTADHRANRLSHCSGLFHGLALQHGLPTTQVNGWILLQGHFAFSPRFCTKWPSISKHCQLAWGPRTRSTREPLHFPCHNLPIKLSFFRIHCTTTQLVVEISAFSPRLWVCESRGSIPFNFVFSLRDTVVHNIVNELILNKCRFSC